MLKTLLLYVFLFAAAPAYASMFFEPLVGYGKGTLKYSEVQGSTIEDEASPPVYLSPIVGARFGYFVDYVYITADVRYGIFNVQDASTNSSPYITTMAISLGWDWNLPIRTYFNFDIRSEFDYGSVNYSGSGQRFGIGYYLNLDTLLSVEFASASASYEYTSNNVTYNRDINYNYTMLVLSFPIEFIYPQTSWKNKVR